MNWKMIEKTFGMLLMVTSPEIRNVLKIMIQELYRKALASPNPWDDWFVKFLAKLLIVDLVNKNGYAETKEVK